MSTFHTQILTPTGVAYEGETESVKIPGQLGSFEVRRNHAPMVSLMNIGVARVTGSDNKEQLYAISGGFTEVNDNTVIIMAEAAEEQHDIDVERAKKAKARAEEELKKGPKDLTERQAELKLKRAINRIKVSEL